jgi:predicted RNA-binding Zn-ribbon protein involved in translation (DUF1610 family)
MMRCRQCNYALWNIQGRTCPECGDAFRASTYEFDRHAVQFCCPHCGHAHAGDGADGLPEPHTFDCEGCGKRLHVDDTIVQPMPGKPEPAVRSGVMPWEQRQRVGWPRAMLATCMCAMFRPLGLGRGIRQHASAGDAMAFGFLVIVLSSVVGCLLSIAAYIVLVDQLKEDWQGRFHEITDILSIFIVQALAYLVLLVTWPLIAHAALRLMGNREQSIDRTFVTFGYAGGSLILLAIPIIGPIVGPFIGAAWWMVSSMIMLSGNQRLSPNRSVVASLLLPMLVVGIGLPWSLLYDHWENRYPGGMSVKEMREFEASVCSIHSNIITNSSVVTPCM